MSGFSAQLDYSTAPFGAEGGSGIGTQGSTGTITPGFSTGGAVTATTKPGKGDATHVQLNYVEGPVVAGISLWNAKVEGYQNVSAPALATDTGTKTGEESLKVFGSYDLGVAKLGLTYDDSKYKRLGGTGDQKRRATSFAVTAPVSQAGAVLFHYTKAEAMSGFTDTGATQISLGYDHSLSKRTSLAVNYSKINNQSKAFYNYFTGTSLQDGPTITAGRDVSMLFFGVQHKF
jgi:predicted porin